MHLKLPNLSIRRRLVFIIVTIAVLTVIAVALIALNTSSTILRGETEQAFTGRNQAIANVVDGRLQQVVSLTRSFAAALADQPSEPIRQVWQMASNTLLDKNRIIERINVYALSDEGHETIIFNVAPPPLRVAPVKQLINNDVSNSAWFLDTMERGRESWYGPEIPFDSAAIQPVISYAVPYRGPNNQYIGVVWMDISAAGLESALKTALDTANWRNSFGILTTTHNAVAGKYNLPSNLSPEVCASILSAFLSQPEISKARQNVDTRDGAFIIDRNPFDMTQSSVFLMNQLPGTNWQLITALPASALQNPLERSVIQMAAVALFGMGTLTWIVYGYVGRTVSKPLKDLSAAARGIGSGEMRYMIGYQEQRDEIGSLANALEDMKRNLAFSYRELSLWSQTLEKRVDQRTAELDIARKVALARATELEALYEASLSVVSDHELEIVLQKLTESILSLLNANYCAVWLVTADKIHLQLVATTFAGKSRLNMLIGVHEGLVGAAVRDSKPFIVNDYVHWPDRLEQSFVPGLEQAMAVPLIYYRRPIGAALIGRSHVAAAFSEPDQRLLTLFANLASPLVRNAQLYIQREAAMKEAERASSVKTRFLASVTHELRTPLNLIINNLDFMRIGMFGDVTKEQHGRLDQTVRSAEHLLSLINDLLDVSKIEAGEMELAIQMADLKPVLEDAIDSAMMLIENKPTPLVLDPHVPDHLPLIPMDARRVRQVLTNLLSNAVKFTPEGVVTLIVRVLDDVIEFTVRDTGIGIPAEEMDKLFQPFERTDRAKYMGIEGTGLGLPISRFLVEAHGGTMRVESTAGKGTTFTFTLPRQHIQREKSAPALSAVMGVTEN
jgi:signal transduction histidine kinase